MRGGVKGERRGLCKRWGELRRREEDFVQGQEGKGRY